MLKPLTAQTQQTPMRLSKQKKQALFKDQAFIEQVTERVYQLMVADLRREQERRGGGK